MFDVNTFLKGAKAQVIGGGFTGIEFVGILAKADTGSMDGEPFYFTVDPTGKALTAFKLRNEIGACSFDIMTNAGNLANRDLVEVVRYFRPVTDEGTTHNMGGMTAICELDYDNMVITVYPSFCMDCDNFDKTLGLNIARANQGASVGFKVTLYRDQSIQENIYRGLSLGLMQFLNEKSFKLLRSPLARALGNYVR